MIFPNHNLLCKQAEPYYYDLLFDESHPHIPESVVNHAEQCQDCRDQINKLKAALSQADAPESEQGQVLAAVTTMLKLHFDYIGKPVTCNIVKPFLPCLLDPALEIRIPTPIITHLSNCRPCSGDLDIIRRLNLNCKQLCRLSQLFAEKPVGDTIGCSKARNAIPSVVSMVFSEVDSEVLKHLCKCPVCRELLYKERQKICEGLREAAPSPEYPCESVSTTDIFDYAVPYGIDTANDRYAKFRKSFTSHAATCPMCLAKMQELHKTIYNIVERAESDVVTVYHVDESARAEARGESDDIYAGFPIRAEVTSRKDGVIAEPSASTIHFGTALKQRVAARNMKSLVKIATVAAALLIGVAIFLKTPTAQAVTIDQIYKVLERMKNVCITTFYQEELNKTQEIWVSRTLNIKILKTKTECFLWDIKAKTRTSKNLNTGSITMAGLDSAAVSKVKETMEGPLGLLPFNSMPEGPEGAQWLPVTNENIDIAIADTEVYDLMWTEKSLIGSIIHRKWRGYIDIETKLPKRIEWWLKLAEEEEYKLDTITTVSYPTATEIQASINDTGF